MKYILPSLSLLLLAGFSFYYSQDTGMKVSTEQHKEASLPQDELSLEERVGQLFMLGHFSDMPVASTTERVVEFKIGSIILMDAPSDPSVIANWTQQWQSAAESPLLISIDQEGGVVTRLKSPEYVTTPQPELRTTEGAEVVAAARAQALQTLGINTNLSPVLDESSQADAFMYNRTFEDSEMISALGNAMVIGYQNNSVLAAPKHYPGHPDTADDSHITLPVLEIDVNEYKDHTSHFAEIIALGNVHLLMTAHVSVPALDVDKPATLSPAILSDLRSRLNYTGAVITDDLAMEPISGRWSYEEAAVLALLAGADIVLVAAEPEKIGNTVNAVIEAVREGVLEEDRINEAYARVQEAKKVVQ